MMLDFLNQYARAACLDSVRFNSLFPDGVKKADFLLFEESTVCEFKEVKNLDVVKRVEHVAKKNADSKGNLKRDLYNTISNALSLANQQIKETREILGMSASLGLVIIENQIPKDLSVLALMDAANRKMMGGLDCVDGVLCLDFTNTFVDENGSYIQPAQIVARNTDRSERLYRLVGELLMDFGKGNNRPVIGEFHISKADQKWTTDTQGKYMNFDATLNTIGNEIITSRETDNPS